MTSPATALVEAFHGRTPLRVGSLIVTVFGDAIVPRGARVSLVSLVTILGMFRLGDGVVRTALSRLVADGWLERWKVGRNTFYAPTARGRLEIETAARFIYTAPFQDAWSGTLDMVLLEASADRAREREHLIESGWGGLTPDVLIAPVAGEALAATGIHLKVEPVGGDAAQRLAARAWPLADVAARYEAFNLVFAPIAADLKAAALASPLPQDALLIRLMLVHEYRRIILRDPRLPAALLPATWPGREAYTLCRALYAALAAPSEHWLDQHAESDDGMLPAADRSIAGRFV